MANTDFTPAARTSTDVQIGLVVADQRTGERSQVIYADSRTVLTRDETGSTTLTPRRSFETELGTRYRPVPDGVADVDAGQYDELRDRLVEYDRADGRKAKHKADALREALDILASPATTDAAGNHDAAANTGSAGEGPSAETDEEVAFEEIPGVGPETAGNLRSQGFVTVGDLTEASDDVLLSVAGVGPGGLERIRRFIE